jgi:hypothetical protein
MSIRIYTKTKHIHSKNTYQQKLYGVIEGPIHQIMKFYPNEFSFLRHETKLTLRKKKSNE